MSIGTVTKENSMELPQEIKGGLLHDPAIPFLNLYIGWKQVDNTWSLFLCYYLLVIVLFSIHMAINLILPHPVQRKWNHSLEEVYLHPNVHCNVIHNNQDEESSTMKKEGHLAICYKMGEPGGHCAKWGKPDTERHMLHDIMYKWKFKKKVKFIEIKSRMVFVIGWWLGAIQRSW